MICGGLLLAGDEFLPIWLDPRFLGGDTSYQVLAILAWATLWRASTSCGRQILFGMRRMRLLAGMAFLEAGLNIGLSIVFVQFYGLPGVALGTLASIVVVYVIGQNIFVSAEWAVPVYAKSSPCLCGGGAKGLSTPPETPKAYCVMRPR